jgi:hypothetical protein
MVSRKPAPSDEVNLIKAPHQKLKLTDHQQQEFIRCAIDPVYFARTYIWVQHPTRGKIPFDLYDYQVHMIQSFADYRQVIGMCSRQLGKSTCAAAFIIWFAIFQEDVNVLIAANKFKAATEIMDRIRFSYQELPDWLRPGVMIWNVQKIQFDNGSKIESTTTTSDAGRGKSISLLYCLAGESTVTVRNKSTGDIEVLSLKDLHARLGKEKNAWS